MQQLRSHNEPKKEVSYLLPDDYENDILEDIRRNDIKPGYGFDDPGIDVWLRFKEKEFWLNVGNPNVGKSYMMFYLLTILAKTHGLKFLIYSQENDINDIKQTVLEFWLGKKLYGLGDVEFKSGLAKISNHFKFIDPKQIFSYKQVLRQCEIAMEKWEFNAFLIDPYNALTVDRELFSQIGGGHEYHYEVASELVNFAHNKVALILNHHTVTEIQRGIDSNSQTKVPLLSYVEGGGKFVAKADTGTVMHRQIFDKETYNITQIHVQKIRTKRKGGKPTPWARPIELRLSNNGCQFNIIDSYDDIREQKMNDYNEPEQAPF